MSNVNNIKKLNFAAFAIILTTLITGCSAKTGQGSSTDKQIVFNPDEPMNHTSVFEDKSLAQISDLITTTQTQSLIEFDVVDANTRRPVIVNLKDGQTINLANLPEKLSIEARVANSVGEKSVKIAFGNVRKTENEAPYTIFGDNERTMTSKPFQLGDLILSATAHEKVRAGGKVLAAAQIKVTVRKLVNCTTASCDGDDDENLNCALGFPNNSSKVREVFSVNSVNSPDSCNNYKMNITETCINGDIQTPSVVFFENCSRVGDDTEATDEVNGIVRLEMENSTLSDSNWKKEAFLGKEMLVWRGSNQYSGAPNSARIVNNFKLNRCGTFKLVVHAARDLAGRPAPADGEDCNASGSFCIDEENDVSVGMEQASTTVQSLEKVYMHFFYYNDPTRMQVFPIGEWASGGRVDRPARQIPLYRITKLDDLKLIVAPRSKNFMIDALELQRVDDATCEGSTGGGGSSSSTGGGGNNGGGTATLGTLSDLQAAITRPLIYFGKYKRDAAGNILTNTDGSSQKTNGGCNDCQGLGTGVALAANSHAGDVRSDARLLENIRYLLIPGREPGFNGGYNSQHEVIATSMFAIAKHTDRIWNQLSSSEKSKINALMKASLVANAYTSDSSNPGYGIDGDSNIYLGGNPNYRQGMIGSILVAISYFGVSEADNILKTFNHAQFISELVALGNVNTHETWTYNPPSGYTNNSPRGAWRKPSASDIESKIRSFDYKYDTGVRVNGNPVLATVTLNEVSKLFKAITDRTYRVAIACGLNDGAGRTDGGCGRVVSGCDTLPNKGQPAAIVEFASGNRSSTVYAYDVFKANQATLLSLISANLFNKTEIGDVLSKNIMGNDDLYEKLQRGYFNSKEGKACSEQSTWRLSDTGRSFEVTFPAWQQILKPYLLGSSSGGGSSSSSSSGGGTGGLACSNGLLDGQSKTIQVWDSPTVIKPATCGAGTPFVTESCVNGNIIFAMLPPGKHQQCVAIDDPNSGGGGDVLPGTGGCSCQRPALAAGVIPSPSTVGFCGTLNRTIPTSDLVGSKLTIDDNYIQNKNGGSKVFANLNAANVSFEIRSSGVTLCNFKARSVKIYGQDVLVQDGTMINDSSLFVNYAPGSSGLTTRIYTEGGSADAIRVGATPTNKTQAVTQSYFNEIGKDRGPDAHSDMVQTYPVASGSHLIKQNYFKAARYSGTASGSAVNAVWMTMSSPSVFDANKVVFGNNAFWGSGTITNNIFGDIGLKGVCKCLEYNNGKCVKIEPIINQYIFGNSRIDGGQLCRLDN